ncbi:Hypothetical protein A7982_03020 [Minicystis rosea]|nr:Hypothetical protein A7982_03020 [Minicystis rosea]
MTDIELLNCPAASYGVFPFRLTTGPTGDVVVGATCESTYLHGDANYVRLNGSGARLTARSFNLNSAASQDVNTYFASLSIGPTNDLFVSLGNSCYGAAAPPVCPPDESEVDAPDGTTIAPPTWTSPIGSLQVTTSTTSVDLGCGAVSAAPGGSTFVTRVDAAGNCIYTRALSVPNLDAVMDATGRVVVSGAVGVAPVNLGGSPLAPLGEEDLVLGELDVTGHHLWSRRFGGPGISFASVGSNKRATVWTSGAGDVYLVTSFQGPSEPIGVHAVDLGGGAVVAQEHDPIVASYSPSGAHRWSRSYHFSTTKLTASVDGCGSLVIATHIYLAPNCYGEVLPPLSIARFAP